MRYNFCTLFDSYYLTRGIALYQSLEKNCKDFHLYIYAFDDKSYEVLKKLNYGNSTIISLKEFESEELLSVKPDRTIAEYCWTCTASTIWFSINKFNLDHCTYLDADMLFFSSPEIIFEEIGTSSVAITSHNFTPQLKSQEIYGKYCVQFVYFKNDDEGLKALNWWRNSCIEWCYAKLESTRYGDQKYLDYFADKFKNICEIKNSGVGVAPWNLGNYNILTNDADVISIINKNDQGKQDQLVFYHYQGLRFIEKTNEVIVEAAYLKIPKIAIATIYLPYINKLLLVQNQLQGNEIVDKKIIWRRRIKQAVGTFLSIHLKNSKIVRTIYYSLKRTRYSGHKGIE